MKKKGRQLFTVVVLSIWLGGCAKEVPSISENLEPVIYTQSQMMVIAITERNKYEQVFTDKIWDAVMENGDTFEDYLLDQVKVFLENMKTMTLLAKDKGIVLSSGEQDRVKRLAKNYYSELTREEIEYLGISEEDVLILYQDYYTANKVVEELTKGMDLEVSDSEAKVISIKQIKTEDREKAETAYRKLQEGNEFSNVSREVTGVSPEERQIARGEESKAFESEAFALATGEVSSVVESEGFFYIIQCINDYDMEATKERKVQIYKERKNWAFQQIYGQFEMENRISISDEAWSEISFQEGDEVVTANFFSLYQEEFES